MKTTPVFAPDAEARLAPTEQALCEAFKKDPLVDVVVTGFVDHANQKAVFHVMMNYVYLKTEAATFVLSSVPHHHSSLVIGQVEGVECLFDIDEDDEFCTCSVAEMFLRAPYANVGVRSIEWFRCFSPHDGLVVLKAIGLFLDDGEYMFFDPLNYFGIQIGGVERRDAWLEQYKDVVVTVSVVAESGSR